MWWIGAALAAETTLEVCVTDAEGKPVPDAMVLVVDEKQPHRTAATGCWSATKVALPDGRELVAGATAVAVRASAPGKALASLEVAWGKPAKAALTPLAAPTDTELAAVVQRWAAAQAGDPVKLHVVQKATEEAMVRWVAKEKEAKHDPAQASAWCASVTMDPSRCQ